MTVMNALLGRGGGRCCVAAPPGHPGCDGTGMAPLPTLKWWPRPFEVGRGAAPVVLSLGWAWPPPLSPPPPQLDFLLLKCVLSPKAGRLMKITISCNPISKRIPVTHAYRHLWTLSLERHFVWSAAHESVDENVISKFLALCYFFTKRVISKCWTCLACWTIILN